MALLVAGCGQRAARSSAESGSDTALPAQDVSVTNSLEDVVRSQHYAGHLIVHVANASDISTVQAVVGHYPGAKLSSSVAGDPAEIDRARARLERLAKKHLTDWNTIQHIEVHDPHDAVSLIRDLKATRGVTKVYPAVRGAATSLATTPDLVPTQGYLNADQLNATAAWSRGVRGAGVTVVDNEYGVNFGHEDLSLVADYTYHGGNILYDVACAPGLPEQLADSDCHSAIAHGTAVAGILVAQDNGHGVTGFAPEATYLSAPVNYAAYAALLASTDGFDSNGDVLDDDVEPGSIWLIEIEFPGRYADLRVFGTGFGEESNYGGVPTELWPEDFSAIQQATAYGVTVVAGAGNGSMNLNDPTLYEGEWSFAHNLATDDAGSIMVGAVGAGDGIRPAWSNCGTRVNAFAWGAGVATTSLHYGPYEWRGTDPAYLPPNDDPNAYFVDMFGGTSSAAAIVAGAAVLVQSHARATLGFHRYLMPTKLRAILTTTGTAVTDDGGCNIGVQPNVGTALTAVDTFLTGIIADYPELSLGTELTEDRMIALRTTGVGIICREHDPQHSDPTCPDSEIWPAGMSTQRGKALDFDGDGRADLIAAKNGEWKIDLSSVGSGGDNYGSWDVTITFPPLPGRWVWPYAEDMNNDMRTDIVMYDKQNGKWYIAYMSRALTEGTWTGWDQIVDYSASWTDTLTMDTSTSHYSRPVPGDYNFDNWTDIAIACSDGYWRVDYGGPNGFDGVWDETLQYLTPAKLAAAPGWAYIPMNTADAGVSETFSWPRLTYKIPDGLTGAGSLFVPNPAADYADPPDPTSNWADGLAAVFGGNDNIVLPGQYSTYTSRGFGIRSHDGFWRLAQLRSGDFEVVPITPDINFGGLSCHPIVADFDGDFLDDRVTLCPEGWRIAYSSDRFSDLEATDGGRYIPLGYNVHEFVLPGRTYAGGVTYARAQQLISMAHVLRPSVPASIPADMLSRNACLAAGPSTECQ